MRISMVFDQKRCLFTFSTYIELGTILITSPLPFAIGTYLVILFVHGSQIILLKTPQSNHQHEKFSKDLVDTPTYFSSSCLTICDDLVLVGKMPSKQDQLIHLHRDLDSLLISAACMIQLWRCLVCRGDKVRISNKIYQL